LYNTTYSVFSCVLPEQGVGYDYAGTIVDIGQNAANKCSFKIGDNVCGLYYGPFSSEGTLQEYIEINPTNRAGCTITKKPSNLTFDEAASFPLAYGTATGMIGKHDISGKKVLILGGATSVGRYIIQLAKIKGAKEIVTTNSSVSAEIVSGLGSSKQIDYTKYNSVLEPVLQSVQETGEFDFIFDTCGSSDLLKDIGVLLKPKSANSAYVTCVGDNKFVYTKFSFLGNALSMVSPIVRAVSAYVGLSSYNYEGFVLGSSKEWIEEGKRYLEEGKIKPFIDSTYELENFQAAIDRLNSNRANGKVIVKVDSS
jgi:NADPH:quinone reductase-like Zn-dependent oxidoreductase